MELKTKYQYTYFIYPYFVEKKDYVNYLHSLLRKPECELKLFDKKKDIQIDSYFLPEIKNKMFWSLYLSKEGLRDYNSLDNKMKATVLSKKEACIFEYNIRETHSISTQSSVVISFRLIIFLLPPQKT